MLAGRFRPGSAGIGAESWAALVQPAVNTAGYRPGLAPGGYATIYGTNLSTTSASPNGVPFPETLGNVTVTLNGTRMPLLLVSPTQINFQVPFSMAPGNATLVVTSSGFSTPAAVVDILPIAPGLFQTTGGHITAVNQDGSFNSPVNPARTGTVVVLYATGTGAFARALPSGGLTPPDSLDTINSSVTVTVGGTAAELLFAGAAPGQGSGLAQINVRLPVTLRPGEQSLVLNVAGQPSNMPLISVAAR